MGDFPNIFKRIREQSGLTQQQMADKLGISRSAIGMYEKGEREPNFETLELIADTFNVDMNFLLGKKPTTEVIPDTYYLNDDARDMAAVTPESVICRSGLSSFIMTARSPKYSLHSRVWVDLPVPLLAVKR